MIVDVGIVDAKGNLQQDLVIAHCTIVKTNKAITERLIVIPFQLVSSGTSSIHVYSKHMP